MSLDIRVPIGIMFVVLGGLLLGYDLVVADPAIYERSLGININRWWGILLLVFGVLMWFFGRRGTSAMRPTAQSAEGRTIEEIEHRAGLEREPDSRTH